MMEEDEKVFCLLQEVLMLVEPMILLFILLKEYFLNSLILKAILKIYDLIFILIMIYDYQFYFFVESCFYFQKFNFLT